MTSPTQSRGGRRILIIGNSASGKSTMASQLADEHDLAHLDLDTLAWEPTDPPTRAPLDVAGAAIREFTAAHDDWVVEGCYADLVDLLLSDAHELLFLDLPVETCQQRARERSWEPHKYASKAAQDEKLEMLLEWIAAYPDRPGVLGRSAHLALFESFEGQRRHLTR